MTTKISLKKAATTQVRSASNKPEAWTPWKVLKAGAMMWLAGSQGLASATRVLDGYDGGVSSALPYVSGKYLTFDNGTRFSPLLGVNKVDSRGCGVYGGNQVSYNDEVRLIDFAENEMNFGLMRYALESDKVTYTENQTVVTNKTYLGQIVDLVNYRWNTYQRSTIVSLWLDPSEQTDGAPTNATGPTLEVLAGAAAQAGRHMLIGVTNEVHPENPSAATDAGIRDRMQWAVDTIRNQSSETIVVVAEPRYWNDYVSPVYEANPLIDSANTQSPQILYSLHMYDGDWATIASRLDSINSGRLPYIIEEAGPKGETIEGQGPDADANMTYPVMCQLVNQAQQMGLPLLFWVLEPAACFPSMTHSVDANAADAATNLTLNTYGQLVQNTTRTGQCNYLPPAALTPPKKPHVKSVSFIEVCIAVGVSGSVIASALIACLCARRRRALEPSATTAPTTATV